MSTEMQRKGSKTITPRGHRDRQKSMESLWRKLDEMKIEKRLLTAESPKDTVLI